MLKLVICLTKNIMTRIKAQLIAFLLVFVAASVCAEENLDSKLNLVNAWIKKPMPGMMMTAGFVEITNLSEQTIVLIDVRTPVSNVAELHGMKMVDGVMKMRYADNGWPIAVGETLSLAPGGKHAMLMGLQEALQTQQQVVLEFNFVGLGWITIKAQVR